MYRVMLADDNKFALEYFSQLVDWKKQGFELVNMSIDGVEAWNNFCHYEPDVVITDVEMPGIDGIELTEKIRAFRPETIIVFLSSYDEFDYARAAIDLNVKDYILKQELDAASLEKKLTVMDTYGLAGGSFWKLGMEDSSIWDSIIKYIN